MTTSAPVARRRLPTPSLEAWADRSAGRLAEAIARRARPGTRSGDLTRRALRWPWHTLIAWALFSLFLLDAANAEATRGYPAAFLALLAIPAGALLLRRPVWLGVVMAIAGTYLRVLYLSYPETCDQLAVSRAALTLVAHGTSPWGFGYAESVPPGAPFPYGPLGALASVLGVPGEVLAMGAILLLLAWSRALITGAFLAAWVSWIELGICGINDQLPALLLLGGLLLLERRRLAGAVLVGVSVGIKPYAFAWVPPLIGFGGPMVTVVLLGVTALCWAPMLLLRPNGWEGSAAVEPVLEVTPQASGGPEPVTVIRSYLESVEMARGIHPRPENTLDMPALRVLAVPIAIAALWVRSWSTAVLTGALIFLVVLFLDRWASFGYWLVVLPPVGIVLERALDGLGRRLRAALAETVPVPAA
ncbi:MAG: hypothetical protein U0869_09100 [Chloroflexota bacterium]